MNLIKRLGDRFRAPPLTRGRMVFVLVTAVVADALQIFLLPFAWSFAQSAVDVVVMGLTMRVLGFHLLLLPTFAIEFFPVVDALPTWTGCVVAVIALRRRANDASRPERPPADKPELRSSQQPATVNTLEKRR